MNDIETAHSRVPLTRVLADLGLHVEPGSSRACPWCSKKSAELKEYKGVQRFKCWHVSCSTGGQSMDSIDVLRHQKGLTHREAIREFLRKANIEPRPFKGRF